MSSGDTRYYTGNTRDDSACLAVAEKHLGSITTTMIRICSYGDPEGCGYSTPDLAVSLEKHSKNSLASAFK